MSSQSTVSQPKQTPVGTAPNNNRPNGPSKGRDNDKRSQFKHRLNRQIKASTVRLIDETGAQYGVVSLSEALSVASDRGFDLVEINGTATPSVCKLLDYGKFLYDEKRKEKEMRRNNMAVEVKEVCLKPNIALHDLQVKANQVTRWLAEGCKTKIIIQFSGREMERASSVSKELSNRFLTLVGPHKVVETLKQEGKKCIGYIEKA